MPPKRRQTVEDLSAKLPNSLRAIIDSRVDPKTTQELGSVAIELEALRKEKRGIEAKIRDKSTVYNQLGNLENSTMYAAQKALYKYLQDPSNEVPQDELELAIRELFPNYEPISGRVLNQLKQGIPAIVETEDGYVSGIIQSVNLELYKEPIEDDVTLEDEEYWDEITPRHTLTIKVNGNDNEEEALETITVPIFDETLGTTVYKSKNSVLKRIHELRRMVAWVEGREHAIKYLDLVSAAKKTFKDIKIPENSYFFVREKFMDKVSYFSLTVNDELPSYSIFSDVKRGPNAARILIEHVPYYYEKMDTSVKKIFASSVTSFENNEQSAAEAWLNTVTRLENPELEGSELALAIAEKRLEYVREGLELINQQT